LRQVKKKSPPILVGFTTNPSTPKVLPDRRRHPRRSRIQHSSAAIPYHPSPPSAYEIQRSKLDGAINFTPAHQPRPVNQRLKFSSSDGPAPALPGGHQKDHRKRVVQTSRTPANHWPRRSEPKPKKNQSSRNYLKSAGTETCRFDVLKKSQKNNPKKKLWASGGDQASFSKPGTDDGTRGGGGGRGM